MTARQRRLLEWYQHPEGHMLVTGPRGCGKTTLINWFDDYFGPFNGYRSFKSGNQTYLANRFGKQVFAIGQLEESRMKPLWDGFDKATELLRQLNESSDKVIILDEVGHMERRVPDFIEAIIMLAQTHRLLIVIRQTNHALEGRLTELGNYELYHLD